MGGRGRNCQHDEDVFIECATPFADLHGITQSDRNLARNSQSTVNTSMSVAGAAVTATQYSAIDGDYGNYTNNGTSCSSTGSLMVTLPSSLSGKGAHFKPTHFLA